jgi:phytoene dehydrogenase-like protein
MADATFDAVIVGAGHNGMTLGAYLARAGMSVAIFERRHEDGGGANTEEATVPGFSCLPITTSSSRSWAPA